MDDIKEIHTRLAKRNHERMKRLVLLKIARLGSPELEHTVLVQRSQNFATAKKLHPLLDELIHDGLIVETWTVDAHHYNLTDKALTVKEIADAILDASSK